VANRPVKSLFCKEFATCQGDWAVDKLAYGPQTVPKGGKGDCDVLFSSFGGHLLYQCYILLALPNGYLSFFSLFASISNSRFSPPNSVEPFPLSLSSSIVSL